MSCFDGYSIIQTFFDFEIPISTLPQPMVPLGLVPSLQTKSDQAQVCAVISSNQAAKKLAPAADNLSSDYVVWLRQQLIK